MISEKTRRPAISRKIGEYAVLLLEDAYLDNQEQLERDIEVLFGLVSFSADVGFLSYKNKTTLLEVLKKYKETYVSVNEDNSAENFLKDDIRLDSELFMEKSSSEKQEEKFGKYNSANKFGKDDELSLKDVLLNSDNKEALNIDANSSEVRKNDSNTVVVGKNMNSRRQDILNKVKQSGICFLRDLAMIFPSYSERTIRYDLEWLVKQGRVEKIGSSGPGTFYRALG